MSLIDNIPDTKDEKEENKEEKQNICKECKAVLDPKTLILLCENCFNLNCTNILNNIKANLISIDHEIAKVKHNLGLIENEMKRKDLHVVVKNKYEIDEMNFQAIMKKLEIDKELNIKAFEINQIQANKLREDMKWNKLEKIALDIK